LRRLSLRFTTSSLAIFHFTLQLPRKFVFITVECEREIVESDFTVLCCAGGKGKLLSTTPPATTSSSSSSITITVTPKAVTGKRKLLHCTLALRFQAMKFIQPNFMHFHGGSNKNSAMQLENRKTYERRFYFHLIIAANNFPTLPYTA
jgi:hypothetical protein